jgi:hypothetical protein
MTPSFEKLAREAAEKNETVKRHGELWGTPGGLVYAYWPAHDAFLAGARFGYEHGEKERNQAFAAFDALIQVMQKHGYDFRVHSSEKWLSESLDNSDALREQIEKLTADRESLIEVHADTLNRRDALAEQVAILEKQRDAAIRSLADQTALQNQVASLTAERDRARKDAAHLNECWMNRWKPERDALAERVKRLRKVLSGEHDGCNYLASGMFCNKCGYLSKALAEDDKAAKGTDLK